MLLKKSLLLCAFGVTILESIAAYAMTDECLDSEDQDTCPLLPSHTPHIGQGYQVNISEIDNIKGASQIEQLPPEVVQYIFNFLPLESYRPLCCVSKTFQNLVQDELGPFQDFIAFIKVYKAQRTKFLKKDPNISLTHQVLRNMRHGLRVLDRRPLGERQALAHQFFVELQENQVSQSTNLTYELEDENGCLNVICMPSLASFGSTVFRIQEWIEKRLKDGTKDLRRAIWGPLVLRACYNLLTSSMQEWLEKEALPGLKRQWPTQETFILLGADSNLREAFTSCANLTDSGYNISTNRKKRYFFAEELCERGDESINVVLKEAATSFTLNNYKSAAKYYTFVLKKDPDLPADIYVNAAHAYFYRGDDRLAAKYYRRVLKRDPDLPANIYVNAADAYFNLGNNRLAAKYYTCALEKDPALPADIYVNAADAYFDLDNNRLAAKYYTCALEKNPDLPAETYVNAADAHFNLENNQLAVKYYRRALRRDPDLPADIYVNAADTYFDLGNNRQAAKYYRRALKRDPDLPVETYVNAAEANFNLGNDRQAIRYYALAIRVTSRKLGNRPHIWVQPRRSSKSVVPLCD